MIDRMTSDWAEAHPMDVDGYIEQVYQKYQDMAQENPQQAAWAASREQLRKMWDDVLGDMNPRGNAKLYPNRDGRQQPALMEVWLKAGDYWRRGLRRGDTIPAKEPSCKITRLEDGGWIALFPKDKHLLDEAVIKDNLTTETEEQVYSHHTENEALLHDSNHATEGGLLPTENNLQAKPEDATPAAAGDTNTETNITNDQGTASREARQPIFENSDEPKDIEAVGNQSTTDPISNTTPTYHSGDAPEPTALSNSAPKPKRQRRKKKAAEPKPQQLSLFDRELQHEEEELAANKLMRGAGYLAAATVAIIIVYQTGLIIPLGLIGLATSGLLR